MEGQTDNGNEPGKLGLYYFNSEHILALSKEIIACVNDAKNDSSMLNLLNDSSAKMTLFPDSIRIEEETSSGSGIQAKRRKLNEKFKQLQKEIDNEIQSVYKCYLEHEKSIFVKVNSLLQEKELIKHLNFVKLVNKMSYLEQVYDDIKTFVNLFQRNMQSLKDALCEIDESLMKAHHPGISAKLIEEKLSKQSDLNYMLEHKIIDEVIVVLPDLLNYYTETIANNKFNTE